MTSFWIDSGFVDLVKVMVFTVTSCVISDSFRHDHAMTAF